MNRLATRSIHWTPARVALLYVFISVLWILVTSELLLIEFHHPLAITSFEILKGILFVTLSGGLIYWLCKKACERLLRQRELLRESEKQREELQAQLIQAQKLEAVGRLAGASPTTSITSSRLSCLAVICCGRMPATDPPRTACP